MSNRYSNNRYEGNRGFAKTQKKFVAKTPNLSSSREPIPNQTLSNSLRQSLSSQSETAVTSAAAVGSAISSSDGRVKLGDDGKWVPRNIPSGKFVNYLPQDEAVAAGLGPEEGGLDPVESQRVVDLLNRELSRLLKLKPREFWREVATDSSLHDFLESFLKFRSRWFDFPYRGPKGIVAGIIVGEFELSRRVFMTLYRISSNRDPGAQAVDCLSQKDHAVLLQEKKLLDLPTLLDICAIYGHENEDLTRLMVSNAIKAQPRVPEDFTHVVYQFLSISHTMWDRCSSSLEVLFSSHDHQELGSFQLHSNYLEVMDFINDAIVSMDAFVTAYNHAAVSFSCPVEMSYGNDELLSTLAKLHDSLLPSLQRGFCTIFAAKDGHRDEMLLNIVASLKMLSARLVKFGWKLLYLCYLSNEIFEENFPLPAATKIFPAKVEDPTIRADIIVQTFKEINGWFSHNKDGMSGRTFLVNMEESYRVMSRAESLQNTGWIVLDDEQLQFLSLIMKQPHKANTNGKPLAPVTVKSSNDLQVDEDAAILASKVSQIKDIFPDYGKGFLTSCLEVYDQNPEEVIQRILEGTLHKDLQSLDTSLEKDPVPPPKHNLPGNRLDKGKGKLESMTSHGINVSSSVKEQKVEDLSTSSSSMLGRYVRKMSADAPGYDTLNSKDKKDTAKTVALISQLEYEDEYDDSFDELGLGVADSGLDETDTLDSDKPSNRENGSTASKWNSQKKPQFYVKDGKNYSYKVDGSVAVSNYKEARLVNEAQKELVHGLGRGGNLPLGAVQRLTEANMEQENVPDESEEGGGQGNRGRGRGGGRRGGGRNHYRKDRAMKKHFSGLTGH